MTHAELVKLAAVWLKNQGVPVVCTEVGTWASAECPDVIGWKGEGSSIVIEVKVTRSDFLADRKKPHRQPGAGMGEFRYFAVPHGLVEKHEVPAGWGLVVTSGRGMRRMKQPTKQPRDMKAELAVLVQLQRFTWREEYRQKHAVDIEAGVLEEMDIERREAARRGLHHGADAGWQLEGGS